MRSKGNGKPYNTKKGKKLTLGENATLKDLAKNIPWDFRGYALKNADDLSGYEVTHSHVIQNPTLEPPKSRNNIGLFLKGSRVPWSSDLDESLQEMYKDPDVERYIEGVSSISLLDESILPRSQLWVVLREPVAGELIVPRKTRRGHRVHINPYAFDKNGRQVRISSNFITFQNCLAVEQATKLDRETATKLIVAFLLSSFGQLQFEMSGYNREGVLSLEKHHLVKISVFDPRWIDTKTRAKIIEALENLPFPIDSTRLSSEQYERRQLDELFAKEITNRNLQLNPDELLEEVENELDNWLISREP